MSIERVEKSLEDNGIIPVIWSGSESRNRDDILDSVSQRMFEALLWDEDPTKVYPPREQ